MEEMCKNSKENSVFAEDDVVKMMSEFHNGNNAQEIMKFFISNLNDLVVAISEKFVHNNHLNVETKEDLVSMANLAILEAMHDYHPIVDACYICPESYFDPKIKSVMQHSILPKTLTPHQTKW